MIRKGSWRDLVGRILVLMGLLFGIISMGVGINAMVDSGGDFWQPAQAAVATPVTSDNCTVYATVNGEERHRCVDEDYENVCYERPGGMMYCLKDE